MNNSWERYPVPSTTELPHMIYEIFKVTLVVASYTCGTEPNFNSGEHGI